MVTYIGVRDKTETECFHGNGEPCRDCLLPRCYWNEGEPCRCWPEDETGEHRRPVP